MAYLGGRELKSSNNSTKDPCPCQALHLQPGAAVSYLCHCRQHIGPRYSKILALTGCSGI